MFLFWPKEGAGRRMEVLNRSCEAPLIRWQSFKDFLGGIGWRSMILSRIFFFLHLIWGTKAVVNILYIKYASTTGCDGLNIEIFLRVLDSPLFWRRPTLNGDETTMTYPEFRLLWLPGRFAWRSGWTCPSDWFLKEKKTIQLWPSIAFHRNQERGLVSRIPVNFNLKCRPWRIRSQTGLEQHQIMVKASRYRGIRA